MPTLLEKKASELDELVSIVREIQDKAAAEDRDLTDVEKDRISALSEAATKLRSDCEFLNDQVTSERSWAKLRADIDANKADDPPKRSTGLHQPGGALLHARSWGEQFVESDAFRNYAGVGPSQRVTFDLGLERRAGTPIDTGDFPSIPFMYTPATYTYATPLLDVVGKVTTSVNGVSWVQWSPNPQTAAPVVAEGAAKPEATFTSSVESGSLQTYAHWREITRQALEDYPQVRSIVENRLRQGIFVALEAAVAAALAAATLPTAGSAPGGTLLEAIRVGISTVQAAGYASPNAILINPADSAAIDIAAMNSTLNGAVVNGTYWGVRIIASSSVPAGTAYVGDFSTGVQLFTRGTTDVYLTDSHADNFIRNLLLVLAETRALATVPDPGALCECTATVIGP
jgi:HK97 family phage major capsid protein